MSLFLCALHPQTLTSCESTLRRSFESNEQNLISARASEETPRQRKSDCDRLIRETLPLLPPVVETSIICCAAQVHSDKSSDMLRDLSFLLLLLLRPLKPRPTLGLNSYAFYTRYRRDRQTDSGTMCLQTLDYHLPSSLRTRTPTACTSLRPWPETSID